MQDVTNVMVEEHRLILRMIALVEAYAKRVETEDFDEWDFFLDAVDFIRNYADRFHHAKEEDVLFKELVRNGMPAENSPVAAMLIAHDRGRAYVRGLEEATLRAKAEDADARIDVVANAKGYAELLREHIDTEDNVLYPLAERLLPGDWRAGMVDAYEAAERSAPEGLQGRYHDMVAGYEARLEEWNKT